MAQWGRNQLSLGAAIVTLFLLASCGGTNRVEAVPQTEAPIRIPARISQISDLEVTLYKTYGGAAERLSLADFHGEPVAVIFWAGLCPTSKVQMRELQAVHSQSSSINILGVDIGPFLGFEFREDGGRVASELGITYPVGSALDGTLIIDSGIVVVPTTFFMTAEGELFHRWVGRLSQRGIEGLIEDMAIASQNDKRASAGG